MDSEQNNPFDLSVAVESECVVVRLSGEASLDHAERMQNALLAEVDKPVRGYVVDLSSLTFITSVGLGAIVSTYVSCQRRGKAFRIAGATGKVMNMFEVAKLTRLFQIEPTLEDAIKSVRAG